MFMSAPLTLLSWQRAPRVADGARGFNGRQFSRGRAADKESKADIVTSRPWTVWNGQAPIIALNALRAAWQVLG